MRRVLTTQQAADRLSCSPRYVRKLLAQGDLDGIRRGRFVRVYEDSLEAWAIRYRNRQCPGLSATTTLQALKDFRA